MAFFFSYCSKKCFCGVYEREGYLGFGDGVGE